MPKTQEASIAAQLRDDILRGQYRTGERLPSERDLADRFGVHRSTIRGAFKRLEHLGLADIRPGGARVRPLEEARLEIVEHMLALDDPPSAELVDQTLEVMSGFLAHVARLGTERAQEPERSDLLTHLDRMIAYNGSRQAGGELIGELSEKLTALADNPVLKIMRHSLRTRYSNYVVPDQRPQGASLRDLKPHLEKLRDAIEHGSGSEAAEAVHALTSETRKAIREALEKAHSERGKSTNAAAESVRSFSAGATR